MVKLEFDSVKYGFYPVNRQTSVAQACWLPPRINPDGRLVVAVVYLRHR